MFDLDVSANCPFLLDLILVKSVNNVFLNLYSIGLQVDFLSFNRLNRMMPPQSPIQISMTYSVFNG